MKQSAGYYPLDDIRVLDLSWVWSGPMVGYILAEFGAEVIKVEHSQRLDNVRLRGAPIINGKKISGPSIEVGPYFHNLNRNKLSITLNLKKTKGVQLFLDLVKQSDVLIENFTPETLPKLGLDYQTLSNYRPELIVLSLYGMGKSGPLANVRAYAPIISSLTGIEYLIGYEGEAPLGMMNFGLSDPNAAMQGVLAVLGALLQRDDTGQGVHIEISQLEAALNLMGEAMLEYQMSGTIPGSLANHDRNQAPHGIYPCKGKDQWIAISAASDDQWDKLANAIAGPNRAFPGEWSTVQGRIRNRNQIDEVISAWTAHFTKEQLFGVLQEQGVPAAPVLSMEEVNMNEHLCYRRLRQKAIHPYLGEELLYSVPWNFNGFEGDIRRSAPLLGEHNSYVFGELLGLSEEQLQLLVKDKIIY